MCAQLPQSVLAVPLSAVIRDPERANNFAVMIADGGGDTQTARFARVEEVIYGNIIAAQAA